MLLKVSEVAARLRVSASCVYRLIGRGELRAIRIGTERGRLRVLLDDLEEYIAGHYALPEKDESRPVSPRLSLRHLKLRPSMS